MTSSLGPQFYDHAALGALNASDYKGTVAEGVTPMEHWQHLFGGTGEAHEYDEGDSPTTKVDRLRGEIRAQGGVQKPITVVDFGEGLGQRIKDGHHRAVAAHMEGQGAPVDVMTSDEWIRRAFARR